MRTESHRPRPESAAKFLRGAGSGVFRRSTPARELFLVKLAFWGVVLGGVLFVALILWGLANGKPASPVFGSGD